MAALKKDFINNMDYILATRWSDGDPQDPWAIGFCNKFENDRYFVVDGNRNSTPFKASGYRRAKKISYARGAWIIKNKEKIEKSSRSMWFFVKCKMEDLF